MSTRTISRGVDLPAYRGVVLPAYNRVHSHQAQQAAKEIVARGSWDPGLIAEIIDRVTGLKALKAIRRSCGRFVRGWRVV